MIATGLLETLIAASLQVVILAGLTWTFSMSVGQVGEAWRVHRELTRTRQVEHLLDEMTSAAIAPALARGIVESCDRLAVRTVRDLDGDGLADARTSERSAFTIDRRSGQTTLLHRIGRQAMSVQAPTDEPLALECLDIRGRAISDPAFVSLIALPTVPVGLLVAVPGNVRR